MFELFVSILTTRNIPQCSMSFVDTYQFLYFVAGPFFLEKNQQTESTKYFNKLKECDSNHRHYCLIYIRDALWHKSQECPRVLSGSVSTCEKTTLDIYFSLSSQVRTESYSNLRHHDELCPLLWEMLSDIYLRTLWEYSQECVHWRDPNISTFISLSDLKWTPALKGCFYTRGWPHILSYLHFQLLAKVTHAFIFLEL